MSTPVCTYLQPAGVLKYAGGRAAGSYYYSCLINHLLAASLCPVKLNYVVFSAFKIYAFAVWRWCTFCHKGHPASIQPLKVFDGHFTLLSSWNASVMKKGHFFLNALKRFLTLPPSLFLIHILKAVWSPNVAVLQSGSFPGHLLSSDQDHGVEELYWPILKIWDCILSFLATLLLFYAPTTASGQPGTYSGWQPGQMVAYRIQT